MSINFPDMINCSLKDARKVGPAGFEPATKRILVQIQFGYNLILRRMEVVKRGSVNAKAGSITYPEHPKTNSASELVGGAIITYCLCSHASWQAVLDAQQRTICTAGRIARIEGVIVRNVVIVAGRGKAHTELRGTCQVDVGEVGSR
jgi:hypothetical protein